MTQSSPILRIIAAFAVPITVVVAARIFWQGHNEPGGGFIAGVLLVSAGAMYMMAFGKQRVASFPWWRLAVVGLLVSILTGTVPLLRGHAFMDNGVLHLGPVHLPTATFFDLGVLLIVVGALMTIFIELALERR